MPASKKRGNTAPVYISLGRWTNGWKGAGRLGTTKARMKDLGVENLATYFVVSGDYDTVSFNRAKSMASVLDCRLAMRMAGSITTRLFATLPALESRTKLDPEKLTVISLGRWTQTDAQDPGSRRTEAYLRQVQGAERELGVHLHSLYRVVTGGDYDLIAVSQAQSLDNVGACREALSATGNVRTDTLCVATEDQYRAAERALLG